jgi:hypothetical protein
MTGTDWRQFKTRSFKGSKGFKGDGTGEADPLKPLEPPPHSFRALSDSSCNSGNLDRHKTLKPLKPARGEIKETKGDGSERFRGMVEQWEERAAIKEFDGGLSREQAEEEAAEEYQLSSWLEDLRRQEGFGEPGWNWLIEKPEIAGTLEGKSEGE